MQSVAARTKPNCSLPERTVQETLLYGDPYVAEELALVDPKVEKVEILRLQVEIFDNGTTKDQGPQIRVEWPFDALYGTPALRWRWVRAPMYNNQGGRLEVWGIDHERVRRVFSDRRAMIIADDAARLRPEAEGSR